jgi:hypothetical protein
MELAVVTKQYPDQAESSCYFNHSGRQVLDTRQLTADPLTRKGAMS